MNFWTSLKSLTTLFLAEEAFLLWSRKLLPFCCLLNIWSWQCNSLLVFEKTRPKPNYFAKLKNTKWLLTSVVYQDVLNIVQGKITLFGKNFTRHWFALEIFWSCTPNTNFNTIFLDSKSWYFRIILKRFLKKWFWSFHKFYNFKFF